MVRVKGNYSVGRGLLSSREEPEDLSVVVPLLFLLVSSADRKDVGDDQLCAQQRRRHSSRPGFRWLNRGARRRTVAPPATREEQSCEEDDARSAERMGRGTACAYALVFTKIRQPKFADDVAQ
jgi:hypothetical protein